MSEQWPPKWILDEIEAHYERIAEGTEDRPREGIAEMIWRGYHRGLDENKAALETAEMSARIEGQIREDCVAAQIAYLRRAERAEAELEQLRESRG